MKKLDLFLGRHKNIVALVMNIVGYGGLWYFFDFKLALFIWACMFANNLEQSGK